MEMPDLFSAAPQDAESEFQPARMAFFGAPPADEVVRLPLFLRRPDETNAIAKLTTEKGPKGSEAAFRWRLTGSYAVIALARRLFSGWSGRDNKVFLFPAEESVFEDLLMLMHRHPVEIGATARDLWEDQYASLIEAWRIRNMVDDDEAFRGRGVFIGQLRPFQEDGVRFIVAGRRTLLADEMGLGKTPQALAFLDRANEWPAVIVCQPHVVTHWQRKIPEFLDVTPAGEKVARERLTWATLTGYRVNAHTAPKADLYLVHYLTLAAWEPFLTGRGIRAVVFDEAQEMRHTGTAKYNACKALARSAKVVTGLSGTPIYNTGPEIFNVMNTINPGCLGTKGQFIEHWCEFSYQMRKPVVADPAALGSYLRDRKLMIRRRKEEVLGELPAKRRVIEPLDGDDSAFARLVREAVGIAKRAVFEGDPFERARMEAAAINGTRLATGIAKAPAVVAFVRALMEAGEPTLLFAHHHAVQDAIADGLAEFTPVRISGRETIPQKAASQKAFVDGATDLCVIGLRAATGLDGLQARARVVVFAELDWSPAVHRQAEDRAHRMGQVDSVLCYYLVTDLGSDPFVIGSLAVKQSQFDGLMHDPEETDEDRGAAVEAAEAHKAALLDMLRGRKS